ncbi:DUF6985 domain-containing protein [uncultured Ruminococcus sp.]|uniref:DUF6985 domain-containing protein n=1 Tax=uncultured Ruminococcus sp. TaxID=165186 RepID=UPI0025FF0FF0|nr:hypothetical protein [uncultured Ruminococcus sp.]
MNLNSWIAISIYIESSELTDHAEKCVASLNSLPDETIDDICRGLIKSAGEGGLDEEFELPELDDVRDILNFCWFTAVYVSKPEDDSIVSYAVEGEGDWGEVVGFVIKDGKAVYVGTDYLDCMND